jgi:hypothetical protein
MGLPQIPTEGLYFYTPNGEFLRSGMIEITAPDPEFVARQAARQITDGKARRLLKAPPVKWMMRWKVVVPSQAAPGANVYGFDGTVAAKGVCSSNSYGELMALAAQQVGEAPNGIFCIYGIVDWRGKPLHQRAREETIHHIDRDRDWPNYIKCPCTKCAERFTSC